MLTMEKQRIGIDIGKVIIGGSGEEDTSFFSEGYLLTPEIQGAFESIRLLSQTFEVWIISKCGASVQAKTLDWLLSRDFYTQTAVDPSRVLFVRKRPQKAPLAQELGLVSFIDDREDIIASMHGKIPQPVLFLNWEQTLRDLSETGLL